MSAPDSNTTDYALPQIGHQGASREGLGIVERLVHAPPERGGLGYAFRELPVVDGGLDGIIEVLGTPSEPKAMTGRLISVQVKAGMSYLKPFGPNHWTYYAGFAEFEYWRASSLPVLLLIVDVKAPVVYWARADDPSASLLESSVAIRIPRLQTLGPDTRDALRQLAQQVSSSLDMLVEPVPVQLARRRLRELSSGKDAELADAQMTLVRTLYEHGRLREACLTMTKVAQHRWSALDLDGAADALAEALQWSVEELRDPSLAHMLELRANTQPDGQARSGRQLWTEALSPDPRARLNAMRAMRMTVEGYFDGVAEVLEPYTRATGANTPFEIRRVQATLLCVREVSEAGAVACETAAAATTDDAARRSLQIRAAWTRAMISGAHFEPATLVPPDAAPALVAEAFRASAWCALSAGDLNTAAERFAKAAMASLSIHDVPRAVRAFRNAGRADFLALNLRFDDERPDAIAGRLEAETRRQLGERVDVTRLENEAREAAGRNDWPTVHSIGERLRIFGLLEYDPVSTQRGHTWLGAAWRAATRIQPTFESLEEAIRWTVTARGFADPSLRTELAELIATVSPSVTNAEWPRLISCVHEAGIGDDALSAELNVWTLLAPHVPLALAEAHTPTLLLSALSKPWSRSPALDQRRSACDAIVAFDGRLGQTVGAVLSPLIPALLTNVPAAHHEAALHAASVVLTASPPQGDTASAIADAVLVALGNPWLNEWRRVAAIAFQLAPAVDAERRERLLVPLRARAALGDEMATVIMAELEPVGFTADVADAYLQRMDAVLDHKFSEVGGKTFGFGAGPTSELTNRASDIAHETTRRDVGRKALAFVNELGHWRMARQDWLFFCAQLARTTPSLRVDAWRMLGEAAATGLVEDGRVPAFPTHPLSSVSVGGGAPDKIARHAADVLAWTSEWVAQSEVDVLVMAWSRACQSAFPAVRVRAATALVGRWPEQVPAHTRAALRSHEHVADLLRLLSRDPEDEVRLAAYEALDASRKDAIA